MSHRTTWVLFFVSLALGATIVASSVTVRLPGNDVGYSPTQPIAFSHRLHAGELAIDCLYCHSGAETSRHAGIPALGTCMNCHSTVTAPIAAVRAEEAAAAAEGRDARPVVSSELAKLYRAMGLDEELKPTGEPPAGLAWIKVHRLPDFAYFHHGRHVSAGVTCESCHGPVKSMERMRQYSTLSMGWCIACHRDVNDDRLLGHESQHASLDCSGCHY